MTAEYPLVRPLERELVRPLLRQISEFSNLVFDAPLLNDLITRGTQRPIPAATFTRASTAMVPDNEGILREEVSGGARFWGARRVENLWTRTADVGGTGWTVRASLTVTSGQSDPFGGTTATKLEGLDTVGADDTYIVNAATGVPAIATLIASVYVKKISATGTLIMSNANDGNKGSWVIDLSLLGSGWERLEVAHAAVTETSAWTGTGVGLHFWGSTGAPMDVYVAAPQLENVSGQATQTPGEYQATTTAAVTSYYNTTLAGAAIAESDAPATLGMRGLIVESAATNICLQSEDFETTWGANSGGVTITAGAAVAPDGATTGTSLARIDSGADGVNQSITTATSTAYTMSIYMKWVSGITSRMYWSSDLTTDPFITVTWTAGVPAVTGSAGLDSTATIEALPNSWYRVQGTFTSDATDTTGLFIFSPVLNGSNGNEVYAWGAQIELGAHASTHIPTTTGSVTRAAEKLKYDDDTVCVDAGGTTYLETTPFFTGTRPGASKYIGCSNDSSGLPYSNLAETILAYDGTNAATVARTNTALTVQKIGARWSTALNDLQTAADGTSGTISNYDDTLQRTTGVLDIGSKSSASDRQVNGCIRNVKIWDVDKGTAFLEAETT